MESYLTLLARIVVIAFLAVVISAVFGPTADQLVSKFTDSEVASTEQATTVVDYDSNLRLLISIGVGVSAFGFCLAVAYYFQVRRFNRAVKQIEKLDGKLSFAPNLDMLILKYIYSATTLDMSGTALVDAKFPDVGVLPRLQTLRVASTPITDDASKIISQCKYLRSLDISDTQLSDESIVRFASLKNLENFIASGSAITDNSIKILCNLPKLKRVQCDGAEISNEGLQLLKGIEVKVN